MQPKEPFNPYAAPKTSQGDGPPGPFGPVSVRAERNTLVFTRETFLPSACVKCGTQQQIGRRRKKYIFVPWYGRLFGLIGDWMTRKTAIVDLPICPACEARFRQARLGMWIGAAVPVFSIGILFLGVALNIGPLVGGGFFMFIGGWLVPLIVYLAFAMKRMMPIAVKVDDREVTLSRVHPEAVQFYVMVGGHEQSSRGQ